MNPIDPAELSALLDHELTPERADQVREAIARDPALREEYERLQSNDAAWRAAAAGAAFRPGVALPPGASLWASPALVVFSLAVLTALRFFPKLCDAALLGASLHALALAIILAWVVRLVGTTRFPLCSQSLPRS